MWHMILSEWQWDLRAWRDVWHFLVVANHSRWSSGVLDVLNATGLAYVYFTRDKVWRQLVRWVQRRLGPPDEDGWRVKINYERKDPG